MDLVNVVFCEDNIVSKIHSYNIDQVEEAESMYIKFCCDMIGRELNEDEESDVISDGYFENPNSNEGVSLVWSDNESS